MHPQLMINNPRKGLVKLFKEALNVLGRLRAVMDLVVVCIGLLDLLDLLSLDSIRTDN